MTYIQTCPSTTANFNPLTWNYQNVQPPAPVSGITTDGNYITYDGQTFFNTGTIAPPQSQGKSMTTAVKTVRVKAGYLGQVVTSSPYSIEQVIVWESKPKKTLAKAEKAARKAQLRAVERSFE